jgi:hypothetical protein
MNETSRKHRPSLTSPIRISKRQRQIPDDQTAASTTTLKIESALLRLLREVRDQIYSLAIGTDTLTIRHDDLILEGVNSRYGKLNGKAEVWRAFRPGCVPASKSALRLYRWLGKPIRSSCRAIGGNASLHGTGSCARWDLDHGHRLICWPSTAKFFALLLSALGSDPTSPMASRSLSESARSSKPTLFWYC